MDIQQLIERNRKPAPQTGQKVETPTAWYVRYYTNEVYTSGQSKGKRKQKLVYLAPKNDTYRSWSDVEPLIQRVMAEVNSGREQDVVIGKEALADFLEKHYLPWCDANKSAPTANGYRRVWESYWEPHVGKIALTALQTAQVTEVLTKHAKDGKGSRTLSHIKWMLSGVYVYAISRGIVPKNPVPDAKWLVKVARPEKQAEYSLETVLSMLRVLVPLDMRAAVAVALAYFTALRPAEIRGLKWEDYDGAELNIKRTVWRDKIGETKTEGSATSVPVIEPLKSLLEKLRAQSGGEFMFQNGSGKPMSLDSLNWRVIRPALRAAGIDWRGYYPGRRGISSRVTDTSKNALNSTGLLRHSTPITALKHYTRAQKDSILGAMKAIEEQAAELMKKQEDEERIQ
jgi:integrase